MSFTSDSYWLLCENDDHCHCDWRVNIFNCEEKGAVLNMYVANLIWSAIILIPGKHRLRSASALTHHHIQALASLFTECFIKSNLYLIEYLLPILCVLDQ